MNYLNNPKRNATKRLIGSRTVSFKFLQVVLLCCCLVTIAKAQNRPDNNSSHSGHSEHSHEETKIAPKTNTAAKLVFPDVEVLTQDGKRVSFYRDLIKGKKVMINFIYTTCGLTCPMAGRNFEKLQKSIGDDVFLISVSTDPAVDTPQVLKKWGEKFHRQDGWTLITGEEDKMKQLLMALIGSGPRTGLHTSFLILFDDVSGNWDTTSSLVEPSFLLKELSKLGKQSEK